MGQKFELNRQVSSMWSLSLIFYVAASVYVSVILTAIILLISGIYSFLLKRKVVFQKALKISTYILLIEVAVVVLSFSGLIGYLFYIK